MIITDFTQNHIQEALMLAKSNYEEERSHVPILPAVDTLPALDHFADNGLGVAAFEGEHMVGFLCYCNPIEQAFTTYSRGTFSPIHAHGAVSENRERIYKRIYQAAAEKLVASGVSSHAIGLYAHDAQAISAFYQYGFGLRCMDAIRPMTEIPYSTCEGYSFAELAAEDKFILLPHKNMLIEHLGKSPIFMYFPPMTEETLEETHQERQSRYFCAFWEDVPVAFLEITDGGETFACDDPGTKNICGAFCLPEHRGKGVYSALLGFVIAKLKNEGYTRLGVDFESFNPTAYGFWLKHFTAYTHGVVRRIDEKVMSVDRPAKT
jgi:GNAT superfamily N-acetyltransferase